MENGQHEFRVRSISLAMTGAFTDYKYATVDDQSYSNSTLLIISVLFLYILFGFLMGAIVIYFYSHYKWRLRVRSLNASTQNILTQMEDLPSETADDDTPSFYYAHSNPEIS